jgi:NADH:ubiquinone reductase (H+-translocating)
MRNSVVAARLARLRDRAAAEPAPAAEVSPNGSARRTPPKTQIVVVGGGFAGLGLLRHLEARLPADAADLTLVSPVDHQLYTSLLPRVCAGDIEPRHIAVATRSALRRTVLRLGHAVGVDRDGRTLTIRARDGGHETISWDRLVLAPGAVTRTFDIPGLTEHALGLKNLAEAVFLRDHVLRQLEYADTCHDEATRREHCSFVVVGAGYTGTELAAQMARFTAQAVEHYPRLRPSDLRWLLLDLAERVLPELAPALGTRAAGVLARRGVEVRLGTSIAEAHADRVVLTDSTTVPARTLVWCAGVAPSPLIATLGLPTVKGRLTVDEFFRVPDADGVFALGDAAAVPDLTKPDAPPAGQTAQHAMREGAAAARAVAASVGHGRARRYKHRDLGFVVDLGGSEAVGNPLGVTISGVPGAAITQGYHLYGLDELGPAGRRSRAVGTGAHPDRPARFLAASALVDQHR